MSSPTDGIIESLREQHDQLAALVSGLDGAGVEHPSAASEWTVAQVLSHLGSGAEITLAGLDAALTGEDNRGPDFNQGVWDRWNAMPARQMADDFVASDTALVERYESIPADVRSNLRIDLGFLPEPVDLATAAGMRLNEVTLHHWDVAVAFDAAATLTPSAVDELIDRFGLLFGFLGHPDALGGRRGVLAVHTTGPERNFGVDFGERTAVVDEPADPDGVLSVPAETWLRLITGRLKPAESVDVSGELATSDDLRSVFPGF